MHETEVQRTLKTSSKEIVLGNTDNFGNVTFDVMPLEKPS